MAFVSAEAALGGHFSTDDFAFSASEIWWLCRGPKISDSELFQSNKLEKAIAVPNSMRNQRTLKRLADKFAD